MNRERLTLAFGIVLVVAVTVATIRQNLWPTLEPPPAPGSPQAEGPDAAGGSGAAGAKPVPAAPEAAPSQPEPEVPRRTAPDPVRDTSVAVVHRHRFGSCEGTLRLSSAGLAYATSHADDAFRIAPADVETFELDSGRNNLRVRQRGGRTWNFTTRDGLPAALAGFYQRASPRLRQPAPPTR